MMVTPILLWGSKVSKELLGTAATTAWGQQGADCAFVVSSAEAPALFVVLDSGGAAGRFSDSAFALVPGEQKRVSFTPPRGVQCDVGALRSSLRLMSLRDLLE